MKKSFCFAILLVMAGSSLIAQQQPYKVVFDLTSKDTTMHQRVIRWLNGIVQAYDDADLEVVFYGQSLGMVTREKSVVAEQVTQLAMTRKVRFVVCEEAMKVHHISKDQLLPGVLTVPDGIYEIIKRQSQGFGYIKATL